MATSTTRCPLWSPGSWSWFARPTGCDVCSHLRRSRAPAGDYTWDVAAREFLRQIDDFERAGERRRARRGSPDKPPRLPFAASRCYKTKAHAATIGALVAAAVARPGSCCGPVHPRAREPEPPLSAWRRCARRRPPSSVRAGWPLRRAASTPSPPPRVSASRRGGSRSRKSDGGACSNTDSQIPPTFRPTRGVGDSRSLRVRPTPGGQPSDETPELTQKRNTVSDAYDHGDFETAFRAAEDFLHQQPDDAYVKRVAAVSACAVGNQTAAMKHYQEAAEANKRIIKLRCHLLRHRF